MTPSQLKVVLTQAIKARKPILVKGSPGIGKTDVIESAAFDANAHLIVMHPCISDPTDFKGMPVVIDGECFFLPFSELKELMDAKVLTVCFFDDIGQAPESVQKALMQLLLKREINGKKISPHVVFVAATNRKADKAGVSGMLEPVKSRFTSIVELTVSHKDWIEWAIVKGLPIDLIQFIQFRPNLLNDFKASSDLINSPCPRTVANLGEMLSWDVPKEIEYELFSGAVGEGFASEFMAFRAIANKLPKIDQILIGNDKKAPQGNDVCFAVCIALSRKVSDSTIGNVIAYMETMQAELQVLFYKTATKMNPDLMNTKEMILWSTQNSNLLV